jgi:hypothetical protein
LASIGATHLIPLTFGSYPANIDGNARLALAEQEGTACLTTTTARQETGSKGHVRCRSMQTNGGGLDERLAVAEHATRG